MNKRLYPLMMLLILAAYILPACAVGVSPPEDINQPVTAVATAGSEGQEMPSSTVTASASPTAGTPDAAARAFYDWYLQEAEKGSVLSCGAYRTSPYLTGSFKSKLDELAKSPNSVGFDPLFCAQLLPEGITLDTAEISGATATVPAETDAGTNFQVVLVRDNGQWKIDNIICETGEQVSIRSRVPVKCRNCVRYAILCPYQLA
jgi:hypothetical protein